MIWKARLCYPVHCCCFPFYLSPSLFSPPSWKPLKEEFKYIGSFIQSCIFMIIIIIYLAPICISYCTRKTKLDKTWILRVQQLIKEGLGAEALFTERWKCTDAQRAPQSNHFWGKELEERRGTWPEEVIFGLDLERWIRVCFSQGEVSSIDEEAWLFRSDGSFWGLGELCEWWKWL